MKEKDDLNLYFTQDGGMIVGNHVFYAPCLGSGFMEHLFLCCIYQELRLCQKGVYQLEDVIATIPLMVEDRLGGSFREVTTQDERYSLVEAVRYYILHPSEKSFFKHFLISWVAYWTWARPEWGGEDVFLLDKFRHNVPDICWFADLDEETLWELEGLFNQECRKLKNYFRFYT